MKRLTLLAIAGLMAAAWASPSLAADLPRPAYKAPVYVAPTAFSWTGFYVGINGGYAWGHSDWNNGVAGNTNFNVKKYQIGGTFGYNWQMGNIVLGLEGDVDASWADGSGTGGAAGGPCSGTGCETKNTWLATGRGRVGYAWDRFLPYITGGAAVGNIKATAQNGGGVDKTQLGWVAGAGVEWAFYSNWSAKLEYLYADLGHITCDAATCGGGADTEVSYKTNMVRVGVNYRF
ncbi:MAG: outer membrane protein [Pseudolabrys sp.]